jgi:hypothetical protein
MTLLSVYNSDYSLNHTLSKLIRPDLSSSIGTYQLEWESTFNICHPLYMKRLPKGFGDVSELSTFDHLSIIAHYMYCDQIPATNLDVSTYVNVFSWAVRNNAPGRFIDLLQNELISRIDNTNVVKVRMLAKSLRNSDPRFVAFERHCIAVIKSLAFNSKADDIHDFKTYPELHTEILFDGKECTLLTLSTVDNSTFLSDIRSLYNEGSLIVKLDEQKSLRVVPSIVAAHSDYIWALLSDDWNKSSIKGKNELELYTYGLQPEEYEALSDQEKSLRSRVVDKLIQIWFQYEVELTMEEAMGMRDLCEFLMVDTYNRAYSKCLDAIQEHLSVDTVLDVCNKFFRVKQGGDRIPLFRDTRIKKQVISMLVNNWIAIRERHSAEDVDECIAPHLLIEVIDAMSKGVTISDSPTNYDFNSLRTHEFDKFDQTNTFGSGKLNKAIDSSNNESTSNDQSLFGVSFDSSPVFESAKIVKSPPPNPISSFDFNSMRTNEFDKFEQTNTFGSSSSRLNVVVVEQQRSFFSSDHPFSNAFSFGSPSTSDTTNNDNNSTSSHFPSVFTPFSILQRRES